MIFNRKKIEFLKASKSEEQYLTSQDQQLI
jgi:hypothetical protein